MNARVLYIFKSKFEKIRNILMLLNASNDLTTEEGRGKERQKKIALTAIAGMLSRIISMAVPLITVSLTLNYLGYDIYGLWMAITAFFIFFRFSDFGIGSGLQTKLSRLSGNGNIKEWKQLISNTFILLLFFSFILFSVFLIIYFNINWSLLFGVNSAVSPEISNQIVFAVVFAKILEIPFSLVQRTQMALQQGFESNLWQSFGSILSLASVFLITFLDLGSMTLIWSYALTTVLVTVINMGVFFLIRRPDLRPNVLLFDFNIIKSLFKIGNGFLFLSILTTAGLAFDSFIVARTSSLSDVSIFAIATRITAIISVAAMMLSNPLWAANGEALSRGDYGWVKKITKKMSRISFLITLVSSTLLLVFHKPLFKIWLGEEFRIPVMLLIGLLLMQIVLSIISPYFMVLNASGRIKEQIFIFFVFTLLVLPGKFVVSTLNYIYIPFIGFSFYLIIIVPYIIRKSNIILREGGA